MEIREHILTNNDCYKAGRTIVPKGIMVHSTGVAQPDVAVFLRQWDRPGVEACAHAFVHQGGVVETLPWNWRGWHAGSPPGGGTSANNTHISFEILEPAGHTYRGGTLVDYDAAKTPLIFPRSTATPWSCAPTCAAATVWTPWPAGCSFATQRGISGGSPATTPT